MGCRTAQELAGGKTPRVLGRKALQTVLHCKAFIYLNRFLDGFAYFWQESLIIFTWVISM
jgi:hypothetical protein